MLNIKFCVVLIFLTLFNGSSSTDYDSTEKCVSNVVGSIGKLNCAGKQMKNVISDWPWQNVTITEILATFSRNDIIRLEPIPACNNATKGAVLYDHCSITQLAPGLLDNCMNITHLDLSYNLIPSFELRSDVLKGPYNNTVYEPIGLQHLNLAHNKLQVLVGNFFEHATNLRKLNLAYNDFVILDVNTITAFSKIPKLEELNLAGNGLTELRSDVLRPFANLRVLDISSNRFDFVPTEAINLVRVTLRKFIIDDNPILEFTNDSFLGMSNIIELSARDMHCLLDLHTGAFAPLTKVQKVDLSGMNNTDNTLTIYEEAFGNITNLRELNLSNSHLYFLPPRLVNWSELDVLDISGNQLECVCELYNVTLHLSDALKKQNRNTPFCYDVRIDELMDVFQVDEDLCDEESFLTTHRGETWYTQARILRMLLLMLTAVLIVCATFALWIVISRYIRKKKLNMYPFTSQIIYNPVNHGMEFSDTQRFSI